MGVTLQHAAATVVSISSGFILTFAGYQVPFLTACVFASFTIPVTRQLDPATQRSQARSDEDARRDIAPAPGDGLAVGTTGATGK